MSAETSSDKPSARAQGAAAPRLVDQRTTYLLIANDEHEDRITRFYLEQKYGSEFKAQIVRGIPVARLTEAYVVVPVLRKRLKGVTKLVALANSPPEWIPVDLEELALDVIEREPLRCAQFWLEGDDMGGHVHVGRFIEALNQRTSPFTVNYRGDEGVIRLGHV